MSIKAEEVDRLAVLAKLRFTEEEKAELLLNMNKVLDLVNKLDEVDTNGVEPLVYMIEEAPRWREDILEPQADKKKLLANAPDKDSDYFKVPKVMNKQVGEEF